MFVSEINIQKSFFAPFNDEQIEDIFMMTPDPCVTI